MKCEYCHDYTCLERRSAGDCLKERPDHQWKITTGPDSVGPEQPCAVGQHTITHEWRQYRNETAQLILQRLIKSGDTDFDLKCKARVAVDAANELVFALMDSKV